MFFYFKIINCLIISLVPTHETVRTKAWYRPYHGMKLTVPKGGTVRTNAWYEKYQAVKFPVPTRGIFSYCLRFSAYKETKEILRQYDYRLKEMFQTCYKTVTIHTNPPHVTRMQHALL